MNFERRWFETFCGLLDGVAADPLADFAVVVLKFEKISVRFIGKRSFAAVEKN